MTAATLSYAQALRVIGQDLAALNINDFQLGKRGDEYIVWAEGREPSTQRAKEKWSVTRVRPRILGREEPAGENQNPLYFAVSDIVRADTERQLKRTMSGRTTDLRDLSLLLRVIGNFLDQKTAEDFVIYSSTNLVTVRYGNKQESFTAQNLYDLGVGMYLKRSNRHPA